MLTEACLAFNTSTKQILVQFIKQLKIYHVKIDYFEIMLIAITILCENMD